MTDFNPTPSPSTLAAEATKENNSPPDVGEHTEGGATPLANESPQAWTTSTPPQYILPKRIDAFHWEECYRHIDEYDETMCRAWQEEIDKLLIFAGLFSAAVTAFTIESYQWLQDPRDATTDLLAELVALQRNATGIPPSPPIAPFSPSLSDVRINIFWFTSLTLSLGSVLVGIMCLQWVREYQRPVARGSFKDKLAFRQTRYDGLMAWKVPQIISTLPVLLQGSVIIFFAGVFDLLWQRNHVVAKSVLVPIVVVTTFLLVSAILPAAQMVFLHFSWVSTIMQSKQCPYKSPLSWLICRIMFAVLDFLHLLRRKGSQSQWETWTRMMNTFSHRSWLNLDQFWNTSSWDKSLQQVPFKLKYIASNYDHALFSALRWMGNNFPRHSDVTYHIYQCIPDLDGGTSDMLLREAYRQDATNMQTIPFDEIMIRGDPCYEELVSAIYLKSFHLNPPTILEHWIRAISAELDVLAYFPGDRLHDLLPAEKDVIFPQILLYTATVFQRRAPGDLFDNAINILHVMSKQQLSPQSLDVFKQNLNAIKDRLDYPERVKPRADPLYDIGYFTARMNERALSWTHKNPSEEVYLSLVDFAWTIGRKNQEWKEYHNLPNHPQLDAGWLKVFRLPSWEVATATPGPELWWVNDGIKYSRY